MMSKYFILCPPGSGGLFLSSVFGKFLNLNVHAQISNTGHVHDLGNGPWQEISGFNLIGDHWDLNYRHNNILYYSHTLDNNFKHVHPEIKFVLINVDPDDVRKVTKLLIKKAWPTIWNEAEYNKWAGPDWPAYKKTNIPDDEIIVNEIVNDLTVNSTQIWVNRFAPTDFEYVINFKTIMGLNSIDLAQEVANITNGEITNDIRQLIHQYQTVNKELYFNDTQP